jgi:di/tricarboxylate transporter
MPILIFIILVLGIVIWSIAMKVSGLDKENGGNGSDKFTFKNLIAMIILYGGIGLIIYTIFTFVKK